MQEITGEDDKLAVFISYSRDDLSFVDQLDASLKIGGFATHIDRHGIHAGEWKPQLGALIRRADTVVFVLTPNSAKSEICVWEVEEAFRLGKRVVPVVPGPLGGAEPPSKIAALNYVFFYNEPRKPGASFGSGLLELVLSLKTNFDWLREHSRLLQRATDWDTAGRPASRLLSGSDIAAAKAWAADRPKEAPAPTEFHLDYIHVSEEEATRRASVERKLLDDMASANAQRAAALKEAEAAHQRAVAADRARKNARRMLALGSTIVAVLLIGGAVGFAAREQRTAAEQANLKEDAIAANAALDLLQARAGPPPPEPERIVTLDDIRRARVLTKRIDGTVIVWLDTNSWHNVSRSEVEAFKKLGAVLKLARTISEAKEALSSRHDLIITNYGRKEGPENIKEESNAYLLKAWRDGQGMAKAPLIIYTSGVTKEFACTAQKDGFFDEIEDAFGLTESVQAALGGLRAPNRCDAP